MSKYLKTLQAGFSIRAAKYVSDLFKGFVSVVPAEEVEKFLEDNHCTPIGDTAEKPVDDLVKHGFSEDLIARAKKLHQVD